MNGYEYSIIHGLICSGRVCRHCKIDHNFPCEKTTPEKELLKYAKELYREHDEKFIHALETVAEYRRVFCRVVSQVQYD